MSNVEAVIDGIIKTEGGFVNDASDSGGATNFGVTEAVARANGYYGAIKDMPVMFARQVYKNRYWFEPKFDQVEVLAPKVAAELADMGVNMGTTFAKTALQSALNLLNRNAKDYTDIPEDGSIGKGTLSALGLLLSKRGEPLLLKTLILMRGARYLAIAKGNPVQEEFLVGWITNRVHFEV